MLAIEARIGELFSKMEAIKGRPRRPRSGRREINKQGITQQSAYRAKTIFEYPHEVEEVIKEAEENETIAVI